MKKTSLVFGYAFIFIGILGLLPNPIFGVGALIVANIWHNLVYIIIGVLFLIFEEKEILVELPMFRILGIALIFLAFMGFVGSSNFILGFIETNTFHDWINMILGIAILALGIMGKRWEILDIDHE